MNALPRYEGFGLTIESEIELTGMPAGNPDAAVDVTIRRGTLRREKKLATVDAELAFNSLAGSFWITGGRDIVVDPLPGVDPAVLRVLLMGKVMAFLLRQRGWLPLHASGVEVAGRCVLFLGASGAGKSTTAAAFISAGHEALSDDLAPVRAENGLCVMSPVWSRLRLLDDSRGVLRVDGQRGEFRQGEYQVDKHSFQLAAGRAPVPVSRIYLLEYGEAIGAEAVSGAVAVTELSRNSFVKHWRMGKDAMQSHLSDCASVAAVRSVQRLVRPASLERLPELVRFVEKEVEQDA